jgi:hypothetical protein
MRFPPVLLAHYHLRILKGWALILLSFLGFVVLLWFQLHGNSAEGVRLGEELSRFVMEPYLGLLAAMLGSSLLMNDPLLEVILTTRTGIVGVVLWRGLLSLCALWFCAGIYLVWSRGNAVSYIRQQNTLSLLLVGAAPALLMMMLGLFGSLMTGSAALGMTMAAIPLAASLFLYAPLSRWQVAHYFFITYTFSGGPESPDWWTNRLILLGCALGLAAGNGWLLHNEKHIVSTLH